MIQVGGSNIAEIEISILDDYSVELKQEKQLFSIGTLDCWYPLYSYAMVLCVLHNLKDKVFECHIPGCALTTLCGILQK